MKKLFLSVLMTLSLVACNGDDFSTNDTSDNGNDGQGNAPSTIGELIGTWSKPCANLGGQGGFSQNSITVDTQNATFLSQVFQNSNNCTGTPDLESRANFTYTVPSFNPGQINPIDMTMSTLTARFNTQNGVAVANASSLCGFSDWQPGVDKDVTGRNCIVDLPAAGQPLYHIFQLQGNQLFIGQIDNAHSGRTPETRPTALESTAYTR